MSGPSSHYPSPESPPPNADITDSVAAIVSSLERWSQDPAQKIRCYRHASAQHRAESEATFRELTRQLGKLSAQSQETVKTIWTLFGQAEAPTRMLILAGLLNQCCIPQLSFLHRAVPPLLRIDFIAMAPPHIAFRILSYLDAKSLCRAAQVSKTWRRLADDDRLWHRMCEQHIDRKCTSCGWGLPLLHKKQRRCEVTDPEWIRTCTTVSDSQLPSVCVPVEPLVASTSSSLGKRRDAGHDLDDESNSCCSSADAQPSASSPSSSSVDDAHQTMASLSSLRKRPRVTRIDSNPDASGDVGNASPAPSDFGQVPRGHGNGSRHRRHWKQIYAERLMVERNWRQGQYRTQTLDGHSDGVLCLQFDDQYLITGSYDNTVKVWNLQSGSLIRTLEGHRMGIRALQFDQAKLITGSMDGTLRIWNYRTGTCMRTMTVSGGGGGGVNCLHFDSSLLAAGCVDGSISVWDFYSGSTLRLVGHADWVNGVQIVSPNRLLSCSDDTTIRLWDLDTRTCIREYHGHVGHVQSFQLAPVLWKVSATGALTQPTGQALQHINYPEPSSSSATVSPTIASASPAIDTAIAADTAITASSPKSQTVPVFITGGLDSTIKVWNQVTGQCLDTLFGHMEGIWSVAVDSLRVVSASNDGTIKVWDAATRQCLDTLRGHEGPVNCVALGDTKVVSGGMDGQIRIWDFGLNIGSA